MTTKITADAFPLARPSFAEATKVWAKIGLLSFGGPAGQIALMHRVLVDEQRWVGEQRFLHALNYCMLLPGPEAQQLVTYLGWLLYRTAGGLVAGILFVLPGALVMLGLSILYAVYGNLPLVGAVFFGEGGGAGHCRRGVAADRPPRLAQPGSNRRRGRCIRRHLCARRAVPANRAGRCSDRMGGESECPGHLPSRGHGRVPCLVTRHRGRIAKRGADIGGCHGDKAARCGSSRV